MSNRTLPTSDAVGRRALWFAVAATLLPAVAVLVLGQFLLRVRHREAQGMLETRLEARMDEARRTLGERAVALESDAKRLVEGGSDGSSDERTQYATWIRGDFKQPWSRESGPPATVPLVGPDDGEPDFRVFLPGLIAQGRTDDPDQFVTNLRTFAASQRTPAERVQVLMACAGVLREQGHWGRARDAYDDVLLEAGECAELDGLPVTWAVRLELVRLGLEAGDKPQALADARRILDDLAHDRIALPGDQATSLVRDAVERLTSEEMQAAGVERAALDVAWFQEASWEQHARDDAWGATHRRASAGESGVTCRPDVGFRVWAVSPAGTRLLRAEQPLPEWPVDDLVRFALVSADEAATAEGWIQRNDPLSLSGGSVLIGWMDEESIDGLVDPWRRAVGWGSVAVLLMAGLSGWWAARAVARRLELARLRSDVVASVSHELRTPLTALLLHLELLEDPRTASDPAHLAKARRAGERLAGLVDRVLRFSRAERGVETGPRSRVAASALIDGTLDDWEPLLEGRSVARDVSEDLPDVHVDRDAMVQVLGGLLDNACKYSGGAAVRMGADAHGEQVRLWVEDEGPGVPERERSNLFEPFFRSPSRSDEVAGSGLGLAIAQRLVEAQGGQITAEPARPFESPEGLRVVVTLPAVREGR